jgi:hypothetical protein
VLYVQILRKDCGMYRGWWSVAASITLAAVGALIGGWLGGHVSSVAGGAIGAVTGAFAPSLLGWLQVRTAARHELATVTTVRSLAGLLNPDALVVPFTGRDKLLASLIDWCKDPTARPVSLVTGAGGLGKTRLALELCGRLTGWRREWVGDGQEAGAVPAVRAVHHRRALLIVDYAEARVGLPELLRAVATDDGTALRVLMLARSAGDWWKRLYAGDSGIRDLLAKPVELAAAVDYGVSDVALVRQAVPYFADRLGTKPPQFVTIAGAPGRRRILDLHAAALIAAVDARERVDLSTVLAELLEHEKKIWLGSAISNGLLDGPHGMNVNTLANIVAAGALLGAASKDEAVSLLQRVPDAAASAKVATWLRDLYPPDASGSEDEWLGSLKPDRLAESLVVAQLEHSHEFAAACLTNLNARQARRALSVLGRASEESALRFLDTLVDQVADDVVAPPDTLIAIANAIPADSQGAFAQAGATVARRILESLSGNAGPQQRAAWLKSYAERLETLGLTAEALSAEREVIALYRKHARRGTSTEYQHWLGKEFEIFIRMLLAAGELDEALSVAEEQVAQWRADFPSPDRHIAEGLHDLAFVLARADQLSEALTAAEESVAEWRAWVAEFGYVIVDEYLDSLALQAEILLRLDRPGEALSAAEEAIAVHGKTSRLNDDRLVRPLRRLAVVLLNVDRKAEALRIGKAAIAVARKNADDDHRRYGPWAFTELRSFGEILSGRDDAEELRNAANAEAGAVARQFAADPRRYDNLVQDLRSTPF